jgi:hypothetical protein
LSVSNVLSPADRGARSSLADRRSNFTELSGRQRGPLVRGPEHCHTEATEGNYKHSVDRDLQCRPRLGWTSFCAAKTATVFGLESDFDGEVPLLPDPGPDLAVRRVRFRNQGRDPRAQLPCAITVNCFYCRRVSQVAQARVRQRRGRRCCRVRDSAPEKCVERPQAARSAGGSIAARSRWPCRGSGCW